MSENCKVYTPNTYANLLLDYVEYKKDLYGKRVLENSCGAGNILKHIVERYLEDAKNHSFSKSKIVYGLEHDITGIDVDPEALEICREVLTGIAEKYEINGVKWDLRCGDALEYVDASYAFVIGNPPYITYHDLDLDKRQDIRSKFSTCNEGRFDYCYAFIEQGLKNLNNTGKMAYILPNSVIKNVYAQKLRRMLAPRVLKIVDLKNEDIFPEVTLSPIILVVQKEKLADEINVSYECKHETVSMTIQRADLLESGWSFGSYDSNKNNRFGDYFAVGNSVATLCNDAFLIKSYRVIDGDFIEVNGHRIERNVLRPAASIRTEHRVQPPLIIFPYAYNTEGLVRYSEEDFQEKFPLAFAYLLQYEDQLTDKQTKDEGAKWFEYGRSQALQHLNCEKLVISTVISGQVKLMYAGKKSIPYAGMYITCRTEYGLDKAKEILQQDEFLQYIKQYGVPTAANSYRISKKIIENYHFDF